MIADLARLVAVLMIGSTLFWDAPAGLVVALAAILWIDAVAFFARVVGRRTS